MAKAYRHTSAHKARIAALRNDGKVMLCGKPHNRADFMCRLRTHHAQSLSGKALAPIGKIGRHRISVNEDMRRAHER